MFIQRSYLNEYLNKNFISALIKHNITPEKIDHVVCTHSHADHIGNNNLFVNAEHIIGTCVHRGELFFNKNFKDGKAFLHLIKLYKHVKLIKSDNY